MAPTPRARAALVTLAALQQTRLAAVGSAKPPLRYTVRASILASGDRKEGLSRTYVQAIAAAAGYTLAEQNFNRDGVEMPAWVDGEMRPSLNMPLKAAVRLLSIGDTLISGGNTNARLCNTPVGS